MNAGRQQFQASLYIRDREPLSGFFLIKHDLCLVGMPYRTEKKRGSSQEFVGEEGAMKLD